MRWILDTNVVSELRKGARCDRGVARWVLDRPEDSLFTSVLVVGEIRRGIEQVRRKDPIQAQAHQRWLEAFRARFAGRVLPISEEIAEEWGRADVPDRRPAIDGLLAATARVLSMTLVTRNTRDHRGSHVAIVNPFSG